MKTIKIILLVLLLTSVVASAQRTVPLPALGPDGKTYTVIDPDKDGWGELWCILYKINHRDRTIDSDADGLTDYAEMLFGTDPTQPNPPPRDPTPAEIAEHERNAAAQRVAAQKEWEVKLTEAAPRIVELIPPGKTTSEAMEKVADAETTALRQLAERSRLEQPAKEAALDALAKRLGVPREMPGPGGGKLLLSGEADGSPIWTVSHNFFAAMSISADELWPASIAPYAESSTGLNLTGTNQTLALWEVNGGVGTNHVELTNRVSQKDGAALDTNGHATAVAGTLAASGSRTLFGFPAGRGVAPGAKVVCLQLKGTSENCFSELS